MIGALIGDYVGSFYEGKGIKGYSLDLLTPASTFTDETVLCGATAQVLLSCTPEQITSEHFAQAYKLFGKRYPDSGFGPDFECWLGTDDLAPYGSSGAGSSSRVMPIGFLPYEESTLMSLAEKSSSATHDSPDAIRCSQAVVTAIHKSLNGETPESVIDAIESTFFLPLRFEWDVLHQEYEFSSYCENVVPEAIFIGLKARTFEDAMRKGLYIGGDTDTILSIAGSIAEARGLFPEQGLHFQVQKKLKASLPDVAGVFDRFLGQDAIRSPSRG